MKSLGSGSRHLDAMNGEMRYYEVMDFMLTALPASMLIEQYIKSTITPDRYDILSYPDLLMHTQYLIFQTNTPPNRKSLMRRIDHLLLQPRNTSLPSRLFNPLNIISMLVLLGCPLGTDIAHAD